MSSGYVTEINGDLGKVLHVNNTLASADISCYGGHVTAFSPHGCRPVLWMSRKSLRVPGKPLRGGIPVCWPWFGPASQDGAPSHGCVRNTTWKYAGSADLPDGSTQVTLMADNSCVSPEFCSYPFELFLQVTVGKALHVALRSRNIGTEKQIISCALHTYLAVSEISNVTISGVENTPYLDKVLKQTGLKSGADHLKVDREIDRIFAPTTADVIVMDSGWQRRIRVAKKGSQSTVIWNPWIAKSAAMADFGDDEYHQMLCVECAAVNEYALQLMPGEERTIEQILTIE